MPLKRTLLVAIAIIILDQITKYIVVEAMDLATKYQIDILPPYLRFTMAWNEGVNFGLFGSGTDTVRYILIAVAILLVSGLLYWVRNKNAKIVQIGTGIIIGGAIGNVIDRLHYGAVADFLNMSCCGINNPYAFNVADIAIFFGAIILIFFADDKRT